LCDVEPASHRPVLQPASRRRQVPGSRRTRVRAARRIAALGPARARPERDEPHHAGGRRRKARRGLRGARHPACRGSGVNSCFRRNVRRTNRNISSIAAMTETYELRDYGNASPADIEDALERSEVVYFERCPVELPSDEDLALLRDGLPAGLKAKNLSYHPESDSVPRFDADPETRQRVETILRTHGQ